MQVLKGATMAPVRSPWYIIYEIWIIFQIGHDKRFYSPISMECDKDVGVATHLHVWMPHNL